MFSSRILLVFISLFHIISAYWSGWQLRAPLEDTGVIFAFTYLNSTSDLFFAGEFSSINGLSEVEFGNVGRLNVDTGNFYPVDIGTNDSVYALGVDPSGQYLFLGGKFLEAGGSSAYRVALYDILQQEWHSMGLGVDNDVYAVAVHPVNTVVYVGGLFENAGGYPASNIASWNWGSSSWSTLGAGVNLSSTEFSPSVGSLIFNSFGSILYVGGEFSQAGTVAADSVAAWNVAESTWDSLGTTAVSGIQGYVSSLLLFNNVLYVGGSFGQYGNTSAQFLTSFNVGTSTWQTFGSLSLNDEVSCLGIDPVRSLLYVGGYFTYVGSMMANDIAAFDYQSEVWQLLGNSTYNGLNSDSYAIFVISNGTVFVGGQFTDAATVYNSGGLTAVWGFAQWNPNPSPNSPTGSDSSNSPNGSNDNDVSDTSSAGGSQTIEIAVGVATGIVVLCIIIIVVVVCLVSRKQKADDKGPETAEGGPYASLNPNYRDLPNPSNVPSDSNWQHISAGQIPANVKLPEINATELEFNKVIGSGSFGQVWLGRWRSTDVAIKQIKPQAMDEHALADFWKEASIVAGLRPHANTVQFFGVCLHPLCVLYEFLPNGNLRGYLDDRSHQIDEAQNIHWFQDISRGMLHLSLEGIVHRDLAARNILLTQTLQAKITDFGMSRQVAKAGDSNQTKTAVGPIKWMAPEALTDQFYSEKTDVWSFGVTIVEMLTRDSPYPDKDPFAASFAVANGTLTPTPPKDLSNEFATVLSRCFIFAPAQRISFKELVEYGNNLKHLKMT